jgi:hypothetical protein
MNDCHKIFLISILEKKSWFIEESLALARRRARRSTRGLHEGGVEPYLGRLSLVLWHLCLKQLDTWQENLEKENPIEPITYEHWQKDLLGNDGRFSIEFIFNLFSCWWLVRSDRSSINVAAAQSVGQLLEKMYRGKDPYPYIVGKVSESDPLLQDVFDSLHLLLGCEGELAQVGIGEGRLGKFFYIKSHQGKWSKKLVPLDYIPFPDDETKRANSNKDLTRSKKSIRSEDAAYCYDEAIVFDPYCTNGKWCSIEEAKDYNNWCEFPINKRYKAVSIVEVFHEIAVNQLHPFIKMIDNLTEPDGICLVEDIFYLPKAVERNFCIYRCDEIAALFEAFGWKTVNVPRWTEGSGIPYGLVLAVKPRDGITEDNISKKKVEEVIETIHIRLINRINYIMEQWKDRQLMASEIREHFYSVFSLTNLIRSKETSIR